MRGHEAGKAFRDLGVRWYIFGAQAVIAAGAPRLTEDVDVTVELPVGGAKPASRRTFSLAHASGASGG